MTDTPEQIAREIEAYRDRARALGATCDQDHQCHSGYLIGLSEAAVIARNFDDDSPARALRETWPVLNPEEAELILRIRQPDGTRRVYAISDYLEELLRIAGHPDPSGGEMP